MRSSIWTIPLILLLTALGSASAHADTVITSFENVEEIEGLNIDGTLYNVTFGDTDSNPSPFNTNGDAGDAASAIANAIPVIDYIVSGPPSGDAEQLFCVDAGAGQCDLAFEDYGWYYLGDVEEDSTIESWMSEFGEGYVYWAEFSPYTPPPVGTPEPGTLVLTMTGVGLLELTIMMRKRVAHRHPRAT